MPLVGSPGKSGSDLLFERNRAYLVSIAIQKSDATKIGNIIPHLMKFSMAMSVLQVARDEGAKP